jgi:hypothetical protein
MKKVISLILIFSLIVQLPGCYTFQSVENFDIVNLKDLDDRTLKIILIDGREFYSEKFHHTFVTDSPRVIIATGSRYKKPISKPETFKGIIYSDQIESISYNDKNKTYNILMTNEEIIRARDKDYFEVTADIEKGFWLWKDGNKTQINPETIKSIEVDEVNVINTVLLVSAGVLLIGLIVASSAFSSDGSLLGSGSL